MNEEISVTLRNNTNQIQPVSLFTEIFAIPSNMTGGSTNIYSWNLSSESFAYFFSSTTVQIQVDTVPITNTSPYYVATLGTTNVFGVVSALNTLGFDTFSNIGNIINVTSSGTYYYGQLRLSPPFLCQVTSNTPAIGLPNALQVSVNGTSIISVANGISQNVSSFIGNAGDNVTVQYRAGVGALTWSISITNYTAPLVFSTIFTNNGIGATIQSYSFTYPQQGNILIILGITP